MGILLSTLWDHDAVGMFPCYRKVSNCHRGSKEVGEEVWSAVMSLFNNYIGDFIVSAC